MQTGRTLGLEEEDRDGCSEAKETLKKQTIKAREKGRKKKERQTQRQRGMMEGERRRARKHRERRALALSVAQDGEGTVSNQ